MEDTKIKIIQPKTKEKLLALIESSAEKWLHENTKRTEENWIQVFWVFFGGGNLRTFCYFLLKHNVHHTKCSKEKIRVLGFIPIQSLYFY